VTARPEAAAGRPVRVLVTGAGGPAGVCAIRGLAGRYDVVATDADPCAVGLRLAPQSRVIGRADRPGFVDRLCDVARETGAEVLLSTVAEELVELARHRDRLEAAGLVAWLPDPAAVQRCTDKWAFHEALTAAVVPTPATGLGAAEGVDGPWIVKPRFGRGSRDVFAVDERRDLDVLLGRVTDPLVQHRLIGREFTADALVDDDGTVLCVAPRWRLETKAGISTKGETFCNRAVDSVVAAALGAVGLAGPANVQGFVTADGPVVVEINPRLSGGLALTQHAGADLLGAYVEHALGRPVDRDRLRARPGVTMFRHFVEVFESCA
jgi:carbamoyl-phosphate synthase large subunit